LNFFQLINDYGLEKEKKGEEEIFYPQEVARSYYGRKPVAEP